MICCTTINYTSLGNWAWEIYGGGVYACGIADTFRGATDAVEGVIKEKYVIKGPSPPEVLAPRSETNGGQRDVPHPEGPEARGYTPEELDKIREGLKDYDWRKWL